MTTKPSCTLVISTYNWPEALDICLRTVARQVSMPDEIIIADDGSTDDTRLLIEQFQASFPVPIIHIWQPDEGFRVAKIRNKAFAKASGDYIIQIDGDVMLERHYIEDHLLLAEHGFFTTGSRVLLSQKLSASILKNKQTSISLFSGGAINVLNGLRIRALSHLIAKDYKTKKNSQFYVKGCNMAFWRADLIKVNGYDETFEGWGREDSNLAIYLINAGVYKKFLKLGGVVYHIYHKESSRDREQLNIKMMEESISNRIAWAERGIDQYFI